MIHRLEEPRKLLGDFILMGLQSFFEVVNDLVDFCAFDEVKIECHCMFSHKFPDEEDEFFLFKGVPCGWKETVLELSFPAKDCNLLSFKICRVRVVESIESNPVSVPSHTLICVESVLLKISSLFLPG